MATLRIEAKPSDGLRRYKLTVDGMSVPMRSDNVGAIAVHGECGDRSPHMLTYTLVGPAGEKLSYDVFCGDRRVAGLQDIEIYPEGEPYAAGHQDFTL
jgi:hypothetical protein